MGGGKQPALDRAGHSLDAERQAANGARAVAGRGTYTSYIGGLSTQYLVVCTHAGGRTRNKEVLRPSHISPYRIWLSPLSHISNRRAVARMPPSAPAPPLHTNIPLMPRVECALCLEASRTIRVAFIRPAAAAALVLHAYGPGD